MAHVWLVTVPNGREHPDKTFSTIQGAIAASTSSKLFKVEIPSLVIGTLDALMSLADELTKIGLVVENVVKKVERQYLEMAGPKPEALRVHEVSAEAFMQRFQWDYAQYQHQGRQLAEIVGQIQSMAAKIDEDLKTLTASYTDKSLALAATKRKKVIAFATSDLEDFLTPRDIARIDVQDSEHFKTLLVATTKPLEQEFLSSYETIGESIAAFGGPDWRTTTTRVGENDGNFGPGLVRTAVTGSPVVPGSAVKVVEDGEQVLYAITVLRGHYQAGVVVDGVFNAGQLVDYIDPLKAAFREKRFTAREVEYDESRAGGVDAAIQQAEAEMGQVRHAALRWCRAHFGEVYNGWVHLKVIQAFVESVLRYGLPVDFTAFLVEPNMRHEKDVRQRLSAAVLQLRPELHLKTLQLADEDDEETGADAFDTLPFVCLRFPVLGTATAGAGSS